MNVAVRRGSIVSSGRLRQAGVVALKAAVARIKAAKAEAEAKVDVVEGGVVMAAAAMVVVRRAARKVEN